jgi:hypothetical protein
MNTKKIPRDLIPLILEYDGKIKYSKGNYINIIHKHDLRYSLLHPIIIKKLEIMKEITFAKKDSFYFEFNFDSMRSVGLCCDYNFSFENKLEICYYDWRDDSNIKQIRTYL